MALWTVKLSAAARQWMEGVAIEDTDSACWIVAAVDALEDDGPPLHQSGCRRAAFMNDRVRGGIRGFARLKTGKIVIWYAVDPDDRVVEVREGNVVRPARGDACEVVFRLIRRTSGPAPVWKGSPRRSRLVDVAVHVLPASHRARYREEFHAELYELGAQGASRWRQLVYAAHLLDQAWILRAELVEHTARRAS